MSIKTKGNVLDFEKAKKDLEKKKENELLGLRKHVLKKSKYQMIHEELVERQDELIQEVEEIKLEGIKRVDTPYDRNVMYSQITADKPCTTEEALGWIEKIQQNLEKGMDPKRVKQIKDYAKRDDSKLTD